MRTAAYKVDVVSDRRRRENVPRHILCSEKLQKIARNSKLWDMRVYYYENELEDEFSEAKITAKKIDGTYQYSQDSLGRKLLHFICYNLIAKPVAWCFLKIKYRHKIVGWEKIKALKGQGFFLYGNHTNAGADALIPTMLAHPTDVYVIVHPNNVSMPFFGKVTPYLGALPLPDDKEAMKHFLEEIGKKITAKKCVMIYPEAHIWPYYTKIRPFKDSSFRYPVQYQCPVICFTNTYQKRKHSKKPQIVTYVDGPFYPDAKLRGKEQKADLRNRVYEQMKERSSRNTLVLATYIKKGDV